ncbi:hypothetical protein [Stieleria varia]|nr:hypothetical protein [Stieleria varia]
MKRVIIGFFVLLLAGCGSSDSAPKASHFEDDHEIAAHWPDDLADAATKIRERLDWLQNGLPDQEHGNHGHEDHEQDPAAEIADIVSWVPEVAADTNLPEADWLPLYKAAKSLSSKLAVSKGKLSNDDREQLESLCTSIDAAVTKIPEHLPNLVRGK